MADPVTDFNHEDILKNTALKMIKSRGYIDLPSELWDRIKSVHTLVQSVNPVGALQSTQVLAVVIDQWLVSEDKRASEDSDWGDDPGIYGR